MTKVFQRKPHPARTSRMVLTGVSVTAFATMISSFSWNSHVADLAAASEPLASEAPLAVDPSVEPMPSGQPSQVVAAPMPTPTVTVIKKIKKVKKATASKKSKKKTTSSKKSSGSSSSSKASSGSSSSGSSGGGSSPSKGGGSSANSGGGSSAPKVTYTCKSPGGGTKALKNGSCSYVAKYGYVKVQA